MAKAIIEIKKNPNENNISVLRRFSRKMQESGIIKKVKGSSFNIRRKSKLKKKREKLKLIKRRKEFERLKKLGKIS